MELDIDNDGNPKLKVILVGDAGVGKTNLINILMEKEFNSNQTSTITAAFYQKPVKVNKKIYNLHIWDTMGQERLKSLTRIFFKNSKIVILVFDITRKDSFEGLQYWYNEIKQILGDNIIIGLCGNKSDLFMEQVVSEEEAEKYAKNINAKMIFTSAKLDQKGFNKYLLELLKDFIEKYVKKDIKIKSEKNKNIVLKNRNSLKKKKTCC